MSSLLERPWHRRKKLDLRSIFRGGVDGAYYQPGDPAVLLTRRNLLLSTATMATQSVTTRPVAHTISFTGTGTITLSGASTAGPLVGTGASNRVSLSFTPTAASLTMTVTGSVTLAQLERGSLTEYQAVPASWDTTYLSDSRHDRIVQWSDSVGTTPITVTETARGLALDERFTGIEGADVKSTGVVGLIGAATAATYNTGTGAGSVSRAADASNQSYITLTATALSMYRLRITVGSGGGGLTIRQNAIGGTTLVTTLAAGYDGYAHVQPGLANITLAATANGTTTTFTLTSIKEVPGNHTLQATSAARPVVSQRYNLANSSQAAAGTGLTVAAVGTSYDGFPTQRVTKSDATTPRYLAQAHTMTAHPNTGYVVRRRFKYDGFDTTVSLEYNATTDFNLSWGAVFTVNASGVTLFSQVNCVATVLPIDSDGYYPVRVTFTSGAAPSTPTNPSALTRVTGASGVQVLTSAYDLRTADDAAKSIPAYQYVNTATDFQTDSYPSYERCDGTDDHRTCVGGGAATTGFSGAEVHTVTGGAGTARTLWSDAGTNTGIIVQIDTNNKLSISIGNGSSYTTAVSASALAVGTTYVLSWGYDGVNGFVQVNNEARVLTANVTLSAGSAGFTEGKSNTAASSYVFGRRYGRIHAKNYFWSANLFERVKRELARQACALHLLN